LVIPFLSNAQMPNSPRIQMAQKKSAMDKSAKPKNGTIE
jgi:hypothetical protein